MTDSQQKMDGESFAQILDESSKGHCELADPGELMVSSSKVAILQNEKLQLQEEIAQLWQYLTKSKNQQTLLQNELERKTETTNTLLLINQQSTEHLKNVRIHQNSLVDFIMNLETNRDEVVSALDAVRSEYEASFQELTEKMQQYQKEDNYREAEILKLREIIRQQDERIVSSMETHCKDQELLAEAKRKIEAFKPDNSAQTELQTLRAQYNQKQDDWSNEKDHLMLAIENMREKFSAELMNERENSAAISKVRHQEMLQFQKNLKVQLERNSKLEAQIKVLENQLSAQKENLCCPTPKSARNKRQLTPSPCSDAETSDPSTNRSFVEPVFKRKRFGLFNNEVDHRNTVIRDQFFCRPTSSIPVDSTSGPTDVEEGCTRQTT